MIVDLASVSTAAAGTGASLFQLVGIAGPLIAPVLAARMRSWRVLAAGIAATWMLFLIGMLAAPSAFPVWTVIGGLAQGAGIALALSLIALRAADSSSVRHLSAMVQTIGYTIGATYPVLVGIVFDATSDWTAPLVVVLVAAALMTGSGLVAGSSRPIRERA
jgi:CP family cyanate transporter-like MFS transporter